MPNNTFDTMQQMGVAVFTKLPLCFVFITPPSCNHVMLCVLAESPSRVELVDWHLVLCSETKHCGVMANQTSGCEVMAGK